MCPSSMLNEIYPNGVCLDLANTFDCRIRLWIARLCLAAGSADILPVGSFELVQLLIDVWSAATTPVNLKHKFNLCIARLCLAAGLAEIVPVDSIQPVHLLIDVHAQFWAYYCCCRFSKYFVCWFFWTSSWVDGSAKTSPLCTILIILLHGSV